MSELISICSYAFSGNEQCFYIGEINKNADELDYG